MNNVAFENRMTDSCTKLDASFPSFLEGNHLCHRLIPQRDDQRLACRPNPFLISSMHLALNTAINTRSILECR